MRRKKCLNEIDANKRTTIPSSSSPTLIRDWKIILMHVNYARNINFRRMIKNAVKQSILVYIYSKNKDTVKSDVWPFLKQNR